MAKKIKEYGKVINDNPVAMEIYTKQKSLLDRVTELESQENEHFAIYVKMEGMYSNGVMADPWGGQGSRGYDYRYPSQEVKAKECAERQAYYATHIKPLKCEIETLHEQIFALEEPLCVAVWGFGRKEYNLRNKLARAEKELAEQIAYVEKLRKELENFKENY
jgi:predicted RNase H-like nuclease (RuvC/YqgF family)